MTTELQQKCPQTVNIQQLCPLQCSLAFCLNQLRAAHIQFLNLGNCIACPELNCLIIFKYKLLIRIDNFVYNVAQA
ncbi:hypothetical protein B9T33_15805 [Acinetobacter sp. ANC 5054]|uniref:hypothetical protein n=1 Tax=Acinetobacter sp. ANC 5054 TaxID=1977877 RepID=UPI000A352395|nr:hypothetical protein [Acinetobacter sp. ANC 5054]OTG76995.1 hypothetical protein B9T33_15805 [Acinetobacter sp. ANC 5054]